MPEASLESLTEVQNRGDDEPVRIVPLVFDENGDLYTPAGYHALVEEILSDPSGEDTHPPVYYTTYEAFQTVVAQGGSGDGRSYEEIYRGAKWGDVSDKSTLDDATVLGYDIYVAHPDDGLTPLPCDGDDCPTTAPTGGPTGGSPGSGGGGGGVTYRVLLPPQLDTNSPTWPEVWVGDVVIGQKFESASGCGSSSSSNVGHAAIVTSVVGGGSVRVGGDFLSNGTQTMEAVGTYREDCTPLPLANQVVERPARTWFARPVVQRVDVRYHAGATWGQREHAAALATLQDPDPYSIFTTKTSDHTWYCSKLVWWAYRRATGDNLDPDWGFWVTPDDLRWNRTLTTVQIITRPS